jgi:hypothetical protein
MAHNNRMK